MGRGGAKHGRVGVHAGACVRAHAHTQFKLTNEQLIKTCTLERQHTPTHSTPHKHTNTITHNNTPSLTQAHQRQHRHHHTITMPPPALTHATLAKEDVFNTRSEADAYVPQGHSQRSNVNVTTAHTTRKPHATVPDPLPTTIAAPCRMSSPPPGEYVQRRDGRAGVGQARGGQGMGVSEARV
jgi:hypothetical protein